MKENDIRPKKIFDEYLRLTKEDINKHFSKVELEHIKCPACENDGNFSFSKENFYYYECDECKTLYVNPRPKKKYFDDYYTNSASTEYWATTFYKETENARREKIWKPKAKLIANKLEIFLKDYFTMIDIGGGYGTFSEEIKQYLDTKPIIIEPSTHLSKVARGKGFEVIEKFLEDIVSSDLPDGKKCFTSFELFEHLHDPKEFLEVLFGVMNEGDLFIFTTLSGMGVDIQELWENSNSVHPPHHLNFLNPKSVSMLLSSIGYKIEEITTPGKLDISIMENGIENIKDRFWKNFLDYSTEEEKNKMQKYLSENLLSSHMMIVCRKA